MAGVPLFLERRGYRRRRMMDALRVLPFLGLALWMVPLLWPVGGPPESLPSGDAAPGMGTADALRYIFGVWLLLILAAAALWRRTRDMPAAGKPTADVNRRG